MEKGYEGLQGDEEGLGWITRIWRRGWEELLGDGEGLGWITRRWKRVGMD